jgi:hypothetical protein
LGGERSLVPRFAKTAGSRLAVGLLAPQLAINRVNRLEVSQLRSGPSIRKAVGPVSPYAVSRESEIGIVKICLND